MQVLKGRIGSIETYDNVQMYRHGQWAMEISQCTVYPSR